MIGYLKAIFGTDFSLFMIFISLITIIALAFFALKKIQTITLLEKKITKLQNDLEAMDEQARLIVKTDLELSQIQEELDRKIASLLALQHLSQAFSSFLDEEKIFSHITQDTIKELGFDLCLILVKKNEELTVRNSIGFKDRNRLQELLKIMKEKDFLNLLFQEKIISHSDFSPSFDYFFQYFRERVKLKSFTVSCIQSKDDVLGALILGNYAEEFFGGTREIVEILSTQLAQALENIRLFEKLYNSQKELEDKITGRTQDLRVALDEIKEISRLKSEFVSAVSHELRTPLTSVKGYASLLVQEKFGKLPDQIKLRLERINQQADSMVNMINDLLDIARIESGRMKIDIQIIDLVDLIKRVGDFLFPQMKEKSLELVLSMPSDVSIGADKKLIERVLTNLLSNAIKFTPKGKKIEINVSDEKDLIKISVKDEGIGISEADVKNIFKEFYRVDNPVNKEVKGTGLGLSLVQNIIKAHKGTIWVESKIGEGSSFIFTLPKA